MNSKKEDIYELNFGQLIEEKTGRGLYLHKTMETLVDIKMQ